MEVFIKLIKSLISSTVPATKYYQGDELFVGQRGPLPVLPTAELVQHSCCPALCLHPSQCRYGSSAP